jgi:hypothetical protein
MTTAAALRQPASAFTVPTTISGLWALHPLAPLKSVRSYNLASTLCTRLAARRLSAVQKEYFRELSELVEAYESAHDLVAKTEQGLRALAAKA